jgi:LacI family transcriptional regulator
LSASRSRARSRSPHNAYTERYQALEDEGPSLPSDVSAISFDVHQIAYWIRPRLTTVALPHHKLGRPGVEGLFETMRRAAGETDAQGPVYPSRCCCARGSG